MRVTLIFVNGQGDHQTMVFQRAEVTIDGSFLVVQKADGSGVVTPVQRVVGCTFERDK